MSPELFLSPEAYAGLLVRIFTGVLFFMQGYDKVVKVGSRDVFTALAPSYRQAGLPDGLLKLVVFITSWIELLGGLLLIIGLFKYLALYALGIDLLIVAIGLSLVNPVWDMQHVFPRLLLILFLLVFPKALDTLSLDHFIF